MPAPIGKPAAAPTRKPLNLLGDLQKLEKGWDKVPLVEYGTRLPDGTYIVKLAEVATGTATKDPNKGVTYVLLRFEVVQGDLAGQSHSDVYMLRDVESLGRLKARAKHLGVNYQTLAEMDAGLSEVITDGSLFEVSLQAQAGKDGRTYQQFAILRAVETPADREAAEQLGASIDEEAAAEAEQEPVVQRTAAKAPAPKGGRKPAAPVQEAAEDAQDLIGELE